MKRTIYSPNKLIDQRKRRYQESSHRSQFALRQFMQTLPVAFCIFDRETRVYMDANQSFSELLGLERDEILNYCDEALPVGLGNQNLKNIDASLARDSGSRDLEFFIFNMAGKLIKASARANLVEYSGRECILVTFTRLHKEDTRPRPSTHESRLAMAGEVGKALAELLEVDEIYRRLAVSIYRLLPDVCSVYISLYNTTCQQLVCKYAEHEGEPLSTQDIAPIALNPPGRWPQSEVIRSGQPVLIDDFQNHALMAVQTSAYSHSVTPARSGVMVPMVAKGKVIGLAQANSYKPARFLQTDAALLSLIANTAGIAIQNAHLAQNLEKTTQDLTQTYEATIDGWTRALELRDFTTERHTHRVVNLTLALGQKLGLEATDLLTVRRGAQLHDIGKMGIPDTILLKPGPLDESEWRIMRRHPIYAFELLRPIPHFGEIIDIPYCHHEKWDGSGYPRRLKGQEIPLSARIFSIVDVWDALNSNRPYRPAWPPNQVVDYIRHQANKHFEPEVTRAFLDLMGGNCGPGAQPVRPVSGMPPSFSVL